MSYLKYFLLSLFVFIITLTWDELRIANSCDDSNSVRTHIAGRDYFCADFDSFAEALRQRAAQAHSKGPQA